MPEKSPDIRPVGPEFAGPLAALWVDTFKDAYEDVHTTENIEAYCRANFSSQQAYGLLCDPQTLCFAAFGSDRALGFALLRLIDPPVALEGNCCELKQIYIRKSEYGTGLGRSLLEKSLEAAHAQRCDWLWLCVSDLNDRARAFYDAQGFSPVGTGPVLEVGTDWLHSTVMALELNGN